MTKRTRTAVLALAALAALALAAAATAAYTSPKLQVTYGTGNVTRVSRRRQPTTTRPPARRS